MAGSKVIVLYPTPRDVNAFEREYAQAHVPMGTRHFKSASGRKAVAHAVSISSGGTPFSSSPRRRRERSECAGAGGRRATKSRPAPRLK